MKSTDSLKSVGFDIDGVLYMSQVNPNVGTVYCQTVADKLNLPVKEVQDFYDANFAKYGNSPDTMKSFCRGRLPDPELSESFLDVLEGTEQIDETQNNPQLRNFLEQLSRKLPIFLITGNREEHAVKKLDAVGLSDSLFTFRGYSAQDKSKTLKEASSALDLPYHNIMYVGDSEISDIIPASSLGMRSCKISEHTGETKAEIQLSNVLDLESLLL